MTSPTPEQIEAAKRAFYAHYWMKSDAGDEDAREAHEKLDDAMTAALVAAAGVTPQEPGEHFHIWSEVPCEKGKCRMDASEQVDEAKLSRLIERHSCATLATEGRRIDQETICAECGWAFSVRADRTSPNQESRRKFDHVAHVVAEWLRGGGQ